MIRAVIFDLDGCLVDSEPLVLSAIVEEMRRLGIEDADVAQIRTSFLGMSIGRIREHVGERLGRPCPEDFATRIEDRLEAIYPERLRLSQGALPLLDRLAAAGIVHAIATGGSRRRLRLTLHTVGLSERFAGAAISAEEVARGKPAPDIFLRAAETLSVQPGDCLVVEDSPHGVAGARAAGMRATGYVGGSHLDGIRDDHAGLLREAGAGTVRDRLEAVWPPDQT